MVVIGLSIALTVPFLRVCTVRDVGFMLLQFHVLQLSIALHFHFAVVVLPIAPPFRVPGMFRGEGEHWQCRQP
jgi:hypothetical protein